MPFVEPLTIFFGSQALLLQIFWFNSPFAPGPQGAHMDKNETNCNTNDSIEVLAADNEGQNLLLKSVGRPYLWAHPQVNRSYWNNHRFHITEAQAQGAEVVAQHHNYRDCCAL